MSTVRNGSNAAPFEVLIVDEYPVERTGMWAIVSMLSGFKVCGFANTCTEALERIEEFAPDLVTLDLHDGAEKQAECLTTISSANPQLPILAIGVESDVQHRDVWIKSGATYFARKDDSVSEFVAGLFMAMKVSGASISERDIEPRVANSFAEWPVYDGVTLSKLSARELQVFDVLGSGLTTKEAANLLNVSEKTVESHRESVKTKLGISSFTLFMRHAVEWHLFRTQPRTKIDS